MDTRHSGPDPDDAGFSLVEMVIAVFLCAVLALAVLPLMIGATRASGTNRDLVTANAFAGAQLAPIREAYGPDSATSSCAALRSSFERTGIVDPAGTDLRADVAVGSCPGAVPDTVAVTVRVYDAASPEDTLVSLPTAILVAAP